MRVVGERWAITDQTTGCFGADKRANGAGVAKRRRQRVIWQKTCARQPDVVCIGNIPQTKDVSLVPKVRISIRDVTKCLLATPAEIDMGIDPF